ncbi:MAG: HU family DNA-binding protein [Phycisphaerales bacterium]|jgi:integration host factor subunit beta
MATVTKREMIDKVSERTGLKRTDVQEVLQQLLDQIISELKKGNRLEFRDFGVFEVRERAMRIAQNPKTLEKVTVPAKRAVKFKVGRLMRDSIESPRAVKPAGAASTITEVKPSTSPSNA